MAKRNRSKGVSDPYKRTGGGHISTRTTNFLVDKHGVQRYDSTAKKLTNSYRAAKSSHQKELDIRNAVGPHSVPERHYPKSFFINQQKEEEE